MPDTMTPGEELALAQLRARMFDDPVDTVQVGPYALREKIGEGGFGEVFRAWDPDHERDVAIKLLHHHDQSTPARRLIREGKAMAVLAHPNIVEFYASGLTTAGTSTDEEDAPSLFVAMEYVDGETVQAWIAREEPSWDRVLEVFIDAGHALAHAHRHGIVHRDFKPSNVMLDKRGCIKVLDFGLVSCIEGAKPNPGFTEQLTSPGTVLGTPLYMAPEQHLGHPVGPAADQFAYCASLFHMLYDQPPFEASNSILLTRAKDKGEFAKVDRSLAPPRVLAALQRGLASDPQERWPDMDALLRRLDPPPRSWWSVFSVLVLVLLTVAAIGWWIA